MNRYAAALLLALLLAACAAEPPPAGTATTTPTTIPVPAQELYGAMATNAAQLATVGPDLGVQNGVPLVPASDAHILFGYAKWMLSSVGTGELFGPFAPIFNHLGILVTMAIALLTTYSLVYAASYSLRWIVFLYRLIVANIYGTIIVAVVIAILAAVLWITNNAPATVEHVAGVAGWFIQVGQSIHHAFLDVMHFLGIGGY